MPATYAHKRFGEKVLESLPKELSEAFSAHLSEYYLGLHGPDLLFYYRPLTKNPVNRTGYRMHGQPAADFFGRTRELILAEAERAGVPETQTAEGAYAAGFLCHFVLDSECHGYIGRRIEQTGIRHAVIETEFDRSLLLADGKRIFGINRAEHLKGKTDAAKTAARVLGVGEKEAQKSLSFFVRANGWFTSANPLFRAAAFFLLAVSKNGEIRGMFYDKTPRADCAESDAVLTEKFAAAVPTAASLVSGYFENMSARPPLGERFLLDYEGDVHDKNNA